MQLTKNKIELNLTENARTVLKKRYLRKDDNGNPVETPEDMFRRVAENIAEAEKLYDKGASVSQTAEEFYDLMAGLDFMLLKRGDFRWYVHAGIFNEKFISTWPGGSDTETSIKPDFGTLFNINRFNAFLGWQPSEPHHINLGLGVTF